MRRSYAQRDEAAQCAFKGRCADRGYTLLELVIVVSIISVLAAVALPSTRPSEGQRLDLAASWIADTVRFARAEALRTGSPVYVEINRDTERLLVAEANLSGPAAVPGTTLIDPLTKQPLDLILSGAPTTAGIDITTLPFNYPSAGAQTIVVFDARGLPFYKTGGSFRLMTSGDITLAHSGQQRTVHVDRMTGRVIIQ